MKALASTKIAQRLFAKRKRDGLSLNRAAKDIGIRPSTLYRLETIPNKPDMETAILVARWLGVSLDTLFVK